MKKIKPQTIQEMALLFHEYSVSPERAWALAEEVNTYLTSVEQLRAELTFDDAPADFESYLAKMATSR